MTIKFLSQALLRKDLPFSKAAEGFDLRNHVQEIRQPNGQAIYEFIGSDNFGAEWYERTRFEVDAGRLRVPTLYEPIYDIVVDANLPETLNIKNFGPGGFVFEEVFEGGEVKFASVTSSEASVRQRQFGVGLEYSKKLVMFNQLWQIARMERNAGEAHNALLNHLHFYPILNYTYPASNQTGPNPAGETLVEDWFLTIEDAIVASMNDTTNPRPGPYALLIHPARTFMVERMLSRVPQQGFRLDSSAANSIQTVIGYNGWTGTRGRKATTYPGVPFEKGYLINLSFRDEDFVSLVKQPLDSVTGNPDVSRFILEQIVWDVWLGIFSNPGRAVQEIVWPT
ncbi:MAG: hypothetical protein KJZ93_28530 [Caldilineaceae bacterium]|nr:hypothetical protein [Caldilineaceae bacterium]